MIFGKNMTLFYYFSWSGNLCFNLNKITYNSTDKTWINYKPIDYNNICKKILELY